MKLFQHPTDYASGQLVKLKKRPADDVSVGCFFVIKRLLKVFKTY
jgi:hypothetical protein